MKWRIALLVIIMLTVTTVPALAESRPPILWPIEPTLNPWASIPKWHNSNRLIVAYCDAPEHDYDGNGHINAFDAWVQIENPYDGPIEIIVYQILDVSPCVCRYPRTSLLIMGQGMARITDRLLSTRGNRGFYKGHKALGFGVAVRIPAGCDYEGDTLDFFAPIWEDTFYPQKPAYYK